MGGKERAGVDGDVAVDWLFVAGSVSLPNLPIHLYENNASIQPTPPSPPLIISLTHYDRQLMSPDPKDRPSAARVLTHPCVTGQPTPERQESAPAPAKPPRASGGYGGLVFQKTTH